MSCFRRIALFDVLAYAVVSFPACAQSSEGTIVNASGRAEVQKTATRVPFEIKLQTIRKGYDGSTCWVHARAGTIPSMTVSNQSRLPIVVLTMQKLELDRSDVFHGLVEMRTDDLGRSWKGPIEHRSLARAVPRPEAEVVPCDFTPKWHAKTRTLLGTGATFWYSTKTLDHMKNAPSETCYSVYDPKLRSWAQWKSIEMPADWKFRFTRAGCTQRYDLENGDILLPAYFREVVESSFGGRNRVTVMRCRFDGQTLKYVEHGDVLSLEVQRGLAEPSLTRFGNTFYMTLRNDLKGYVTRSSDGLHFDPIEPWKFDDGKELGSYNTQQHWVTHSKGLFLVYTRRGANNDHVLRHRAPLFIAQVDPERMRVIRSTERILVPERGARLGNFGVTNVSPNETWVTVTEWMQTKGPKVIIPVDNKYGSDNSLYVARIIWQ